MASIARFGPPNIGTMKIRMCLFTAMLISSICFGAPLVIEQQGSFLVGGKMITNPGKFDPITLIDVTPGCPLDGETAGLRVIEVCAHAVANTIRTAIEPISFLNMAVLFEVA